MTISLAQLDSASPELAHFQCSHMGPSGEKATTNVHMYGYICALMQHDTNCKNINFLLGAMVPNILSRIHSIDTTLCLYAFRAPLFGI